MWSTAPLGSKLFWAVHRHETFYAHACSFSHNKLKKMGKRKSAERASEPVTQSSAAQGAAKQERIAKAVTAFAADCVHAAIIPFRQSTNGIPYKSELLNGGTTLGALKKSKLDVHSKVRVHACMCVHWCMHTCACVCMIAVFVHCCDCVCACVCVCGEGMAS